MAGAKTDCMRRFLVGGTGGAQRSLGAIAAEKNCERRTGNESADPAAAALIAINRLQYGFRRPNR
jgi:hypothetical protein